MRSTSHTLLALSCLASGITCGPWYSEFNEPARLWDRDFDSSARKKYRVGSADVKSKGNRCGWRKRSDQRKADRNKKLKERASRYWVPNSWEYQSYKKSRRGQKRY